MQMPVTEIRHICKDCGFDLWLPIAELSVSTLGFYNDGRWPGRCILVLNDHAEHLEDVSSEQATNFLSDIQRAGRAIKNVSGAYRINYAILGNEVPHVHAHLIPRAGCSESLPTRPPWEDPRPLRKLSQRDVSDWISKIAGELEVTTTS